MIKTIEFIKNYWKWIAIGICGLLSLILVTCSNSNYKLNQQILFLTELLNATSTLRDSMTEANNKKLILFLDSILKAEKIKVDAAKKRADLWEVKAIKLDKLNLKLLNNVDSLLAEHGDSLSSNCKDIVEAYQELVDGLKDENDALNEEINELDLALTADSTGWDSCNKENIIKDLTIKSKVDLLKVREDLNNDLKKQLAKQSNWFNKSKGWIGLGTGIVLGILIVK